MPGGGGGFAGSGVFGGAGGGPGSGVCGDGVQWFEQCDDGNVTGGDGCNAACEIEPGFTCPWGEACRVVVCGDSLQDSFAVGGGSFDYEQCDDGNVLASDGCSDVCDLETGFVCLEPGVACREVVCGDGFQDGYFIPGEGGAGGSGGGSAAGFGGMMAGAGGGASYGTYYFEACDDGNVTPSDGCSATCVVEEGYICDLPGQPCRVPICGDGFIDFIPGEGGSGGAGGSGMGGIGGMAGGFYGTYEQCDDGNSSASDGCDAACRVEPGFACWYPGFPCREIVCGDGIADWPDEQCDDGNAIPDDGCTDCVFDGYGGYGGFAGFAGTGGFGTGGTSGTAGAFPMGGSGG
jgi:cysteine-rich repeat protein